MVSLKLSQEGSFGPLQLEEPVGVSSGPVQEVVGLLWETVPEPGVAAGNATASRIIRKQIEEALNR